ncbi:MAG: DUF1444 family protein [Verrucomicrobiota bacterium JB022]|nr:DUF1444 family protein [Verrucomicrobiota bacterium JB022]
MTRPCPTNSSIVLCRHWPMLGRMHKARNWTRWATLGLLGGLLLGCGPKAESEASGEVLSPVEFGQAYMTVLQQARPDLQVEAAGELQVRIVDREGTPSLVPLDGLYAQYQAAPAQKDAQIVQNITSTLDTLGIGLGPVEVERIVPVVKGRAWLEAMRERAAQAGTTFPDFAQHDFNDELVVLYAEDREHTIRYLSKADVAALELEAGGLYEQALANLRARYPQVRQSGGNGTYSLLTDGSFDASLVLYDSIWSSGRLPVKGEPVVAIPTRDTLVVTGSEDAAGIERLKELVVDAWTRSEDRLTPLLFVYRDGKFETFAAPSGPEETAE